MNIKKNTVVMDAQTVMAATNHRLAEKLGIDGDYALSFRGKDIVVCAVAGNVAQKCEPTLNAMRENNTVTLTELSVEDVEDMRPKRRPASLSSEESGIIGSPDGENVGTPVDEGDSDE